MNAAADIEPAIDSALTRVPHELASIAKGLSSASTAGRNHRQGAASAQP